MPNKRMNIIGKRYGRLLVIKYADSKGGHTRWLCQCDCGNTKIIRGSHLTEKKTNTRSCGCLIQDTNHNRLWKGNYIKDGYRWLSIIGGKDVAEHRVVAEQNLGRHLTINEVVHHINGDRLDNHPENLKVMTVARHISLHRKMEANL